MEVLTQKPYWPFPSFQFPGFSTDVTQAFLGTAVKLQRDIHILPPSELSLKSEEVSILLKYLSSLAGSGGN